MADGATAALPHVALRGDMIAPARSALVVVDVQVDFASRDGVIGRAGTDMTGVAAAIDRIETLIAAARRAGATLAFLRVMTRPETDSIALRTWLARRGTPDDAALCRIGSGGEDYHRVAPEPDDIEIEKRVYSGFHGTDLDRRLRDRGIDTLVVTGLTTECCVDSTVRDAFHRDYHVFLVSDACATFDPALHAATLDTLRRHCALLTRSDDVRAAWSRRDGDG